MEGSQISSAHGVMHNFWEEVFCSMIACILHRGDPSGPVFLKWPVLEGGFSRGVTAHRLPRELAGLVAALGSTMLL